MKVSDFDFDLPSEQIAQEPGPRGASRLLVLDRRTGSTLHSTFSSIQDHLRAGDLLVVNDTRVFPARLTGRRIPSGGAVECLLMGVGQRVAGSPGAEEWDALVHPGQKLKTGAVLLFEGAGVALHGEILERRFHGRRRVRLWEASGRSVHDAIDAIGHVPLPPYIARADRPDDRERYQTVYARERGSIAAPTAGLHFTDAILAGLVAKGLERTRVTLHVGYGTFKPVRVEDVEDHSVDPEAFEVSDEAAAQLSRARRDGRRIIAVGTTTARVLESLAVSDAGDVVPASGETATFIY
ncbi:MAG TPA: tRNA preQ1(34) S-adenosylmethionine ribosyltransferase-isomerase QueA, partial [Vicinamibacterales bacterium]